jgi:hypothetical protein
VATVEAEELARVAVPARRGRPELALGNIAGTIVHFATLNAGLMALVNRSPSGTTPPVSICRQRPRARRSSLRCCSRASSSGAVKALR